jgi:hypothetical protein
MFPHVPLIASGDRGSRKNTTLEDFRPLTNNIHPRQMQFDIEKNLGMTTCVTTNLQSYLSPIIDHERRYSNGNQSHDRYRHNHTSACNHHSHCRSCCTDSEAICRFRVQYAQFNTGTKSFCERTCLSASQLISIIHKESRNVQLSNNHPQLKASACQISLHKKCTQNQISQQIGDFWHNQAYGKAPREKPDDCIRVIMEIFNKWGGLNVHCVGLYYSN